MVDINLVPVKYITGSYKYDDGYPSSYDLLWDIVSSGKKSADIDTVTGMFPDDPEMISGILSELESSGYIRTNGKKITVTKTPWDGKGDE